MLINKRNANPDPSADARVTAKEAGIKKKLSNAAANGNGKRK